MADLGAHPYRSSAVDGFSLAVDRIGFGRPVVLLHGWPGHRRDWREVVGLLRRRSDFEIVVPDLRGFGASDKHRRDPVQAYSRAAQVESVRALLAELKLERPVIAGYDVGSLVAQEIAQQDPDCLAALVVAPPFPGVGDRIWSAGPIGEFWYQFFHQLPLVEQILDGNPGAVRAYLEHFWTHWSGRSFGLEPDELDRLTSVYAEPGAFVSSIAWYRAGSGIIARSLTEEIPAPGDRIAVPTTALWPAEDPLFPAEWSDRIDRFFSDVTIRSVPGGHFVPLEAPIEFAAAIEAALD